MIFLCVGRPLERRRVHSDATHLGGRLNGRGALARSTISKTSALTYSMSSPAALTENRHASPACVARLRLMTERFVSEVDGVEREIELPAICMTFDYAGTELRVSDTRNRFFAAAERACAKS